MTTIIARRATGTGRALAAHRAAVTTPVGELLRELQDVLGQGVVALIAGRDVRSVARWAKTASPRTETMRRLRDALQVQELLLSAEAPEVVRAWFVGMNPQLDDLAPAEALADGRVREVMAAARAFVDGG